jgi:hypothetical protein
MALLVKSVNGLAYASIKSRNGLAVASIKSINGLDATAPSGSNVTYDTSAKSGGGTFTSVRTITITVGNNSNRVLIVCSGAGDDTQAHGYIASVTSDLGGTFVAVSGSEVASTSWVTASAFYLIAPAIGTHTLTVNNVNLNNQIDAMAISLYGVDQSSPFGTVSTSGSTGTAPTASVTLGADDMAVGFINTDSENSLTFTAGTERQKDLNVDSDTAYGLATNTGTGSVAISATTASEKYALLVIPVNGAP